MRRAYFGLGIKSDWWRWLPLGLIADTAMALPLKTSFSPQLSLAPLGGTLGFAAPEQVSPAFGHVSPATDIYAIGGLAHFLLTGLGPHDGKVSSLMDTVSDDDIAVAKSPSNAAESKFASVANLALKKAIISRPSSVRELAALLLD